VKKGKNLIGFEVGGYDASRPLVIDPVLVYSTYLGGSGGDIGFGIAVDAAGNAYVSGSTASSDFPTTPGAFDTSANGNDDAFVTKLDASGASLVYSTFLGGSERDGGRGIAVAGTGRAYVTGETLSSAFPTTPSAFDTSYNGHFDVFVTMLADTDSNSNSDSDSDANSYAHADPRADSYAESLSDSYADADACVCDLRRGQGQRRAEQQ
jgi:hypothetical protein